MSAPGAPLPNAEAPDSVVPDAAAIPSAEAGGETRAKASVLARGLRILSLFDAEHRQMSLDMIARSAGLPRMTAYRLVRTLRDEGFLGVDRASGRYSLGPALLAMTYVAQDCEPLRTAARPYLASLSNDTGETVTLAADLHGATVRIDVVRSRRPGTLDLVAGRRIDDPGNAHRKIQDAYRPPSQRRRLATAITERAGGEPLSEPREVLAELRRVRRDGVACDFEKRTPGTGAVAAPVRDQAGDVIASIAVVAPAGRFDRGTRERCAVAVARTAGALSAFLGCPGSGNSITFR